MDAVTLIAGLPVTLSIGAVGLYLMAMGATGIGIAALLLAVVGTMFVFGQGMPRPDVVPRPGEETEY